MMDKNRFDSKEKIQTDKYIIYFDRSDSRAKEIEKRLNGSIDSIAGMFGFSIPGIELVLAYSREEYDNITRRKAKSPPWIVGSIEGRTVYFLHPNRWDGKDAPNSSIGYPKILTHEMVHIFVNKLRGEGRSRIPIWLSEGLAYSLAKQVREDEIKNQVSEQKQAPASDLFDDAHWQSNPAYNQAGSMVDFLIKKHSLLKVLEFVKKIEGSDKFEGRFEENFGISILKFEMQWIEHIETS